MIQTTGNFMLDPASPALYPNAVLEVRPVLSPDFKSLSVEVFTYFTEQDGTLRLAATRQFAITSADMNTDEPQIEQTLKKLERAVWKTLKRDFQDYNDGVIFDEI